MRGSDEVVGVLRLARDLGPRVDLGQRLPDDGEALFASWRGHPAGGGPRPVRLSCAGRRARRRRGSWCSRCSGRGCRRAPRGSRRAWAWRSRRAAPARSAGCPACSSRTGRRRARRTPAGAGGAGSPSAMPSTVAIARPSQIDRQREAGQHRVAVEQHRAGAALAELAAVLGAGEPRSSRSTSSSVLWAGTSTSCCSPFTASVSSVFTVAPEGGRIADG